MRNRYNIYILSVMILVLLSASGCGKKRIDWRQTYHANHTIPYGTYITYNLLKNVYPNSKIGTSRTSISYNVEKQVWNSNEKVFNNDTGEYEPEQVELNKRKLDNYYANTYNNDTKISYLFVDNSFDPLWLDLQSLYDFVGAGNDVFISAEVLSPYICERLQITVQSETVSNASGLEYSLVDCPSKKYVYKEQPIFFHFDYAANHPLPIRVLGYDNDKNANFVCIQYGKGYFYLHAQPKVFANIEMLDTEKYDYGFRCLSYMEDGSKIIWDESLTKGAYNDRSQNNDTNSMFRVIYSSPALTWAFFIVLIGLLLFMLFRSKRMQRIIPDIVRPKNTTIEFLDTISNMYYKKRDYTSYIEKRHMFFLDFIRRHYYMTTEQIDEVFYTDLHSKSGVSISVIKAIFSYYTIITNGGGDTSEDVFMGYNAQLEQFYDTIKNNKTQ